MPRWPQTHREQIPAKRLVNQFGKGAKGREAMEAAARDLEQRIKASEKMPVKTGTLRSSVTVRPVVKTDNPRLVVETAQHGLFQERGTRYIKARRFIRDTAAQERRDWESAGRAAAKKGDD